MYYTLTAHGGTYEQALKNIQDAIQLRLDTEKEGETGHYRI